MLTVFDALRQIAVWFSDGRFGSGPLTVPMPAKTGATPTSTPPLRTQTYTPSSSNYDDLYVGDPVGKDLGLPPKITAPAVTIP